MRHLYCLLLAAISLQAQAQQLWEHADQRSEEIKLEQALPVGGGRWAVIGRTTFAGSHMISVYNADGSPAWEDVSQYAVDQGMGQVVLMPDSGLLHVGISDGCDYFGPDSRVRRYAPDGSMLWESVITPSFTYPPIMAAKGSTDHIAVASQDYVYILAMDGSNAGGFQVPGANVMNILWANDSALFLVLGLDLKLVGLDGTEEATTSIGPNVVDMHWDGQQLHVLANDSVRRFSADLAPLGISVLTGMDANSRFVASDSGLFVNTSSGLYQLDTAGVSSLVFTWPPLPNLTNMGCAVRNGTVLSVGNTNISGRSTGIVRALSMTGDAAQHDEDVEVLLQVDSAWAEYVGTPFYPWNRKADITGLVVNHGPDTLHSLVLSMWLYTPYILCNTLTNRIDTEGFALAPSDTIALPFGLVDVAWGVTESQAALPDEICIVALAPNALADRHPDDNTACETVNFPLGVRDAGTIGALKLSPNPVHGHCTVAGLSILGNDLHLRIMDLTGRTVIEWVVPSAASSLELDVQGLLPATYILSAEGERGRAIGKLVFAD